MQVLVRRTANDASAVLPKVANRLQWGNEGSQVSSPFCELAWCMRAFDCSCSRSLFRHNQYGCVSFLYLTACRPNEWSTCQNVSSWVAVVFLCPGVFDFWFVALHSQIFTKPLIWSRYLFLREMDRSTCQNDSSWVAAVFCCVQAFLSLWLVAFHS